MKTLTQIKEFVANRNGFKSWDSIFYSQQVTVERQYSLIDEVVQTTLLETLDAMMPEEVYIPERFEGTNIVDAVEFGMKKQQLQERLIYLRMIKETQEGINL